MLNSLSDYDITVLWVLFAYYLGLAAGYILRHTQSVGKSSDRTNLEEENSYLLGFPPATNMLAKLIRHIVHYLKITPVTWNQMMEVYLNSNFGDDNKLSRERSVARGNLNKELRSANVSWNVFLKFLRFLNPSSVTMRVEITQKDGSRSEHSFDLLKHE